MWTQRCSSLLCWEGAPRHNPGSRWGCAPTKLIHKSGWGGVCGVQFFSLGQNICTPLTQVVATLFPPSPMSLLSSSIPSASCCCHLVHRPHLWSPLLTCLPAQSHTPAHPCQFLGNLSSTVSFHYHNLLSPQLFFLQRSFPSLAATFHRYCLDSVTMEICTLSPQDLFSTLQSESKVSPALKIHDAFFLTCDEMEALSWLHET